MDKLLKNKWAIIILSIIPIVLIAIGLIMVSIVPKSPFVSIDGDVEIRTVDYYAKASGEVKSIFVKMGEVVNEGEIIATINKSALENEIKQLEETILVKETKLTRLTKGTNNESISASRKMAQNTISINAERVKLAQEGLDNANKELAVQKELYDVGAISKNEFEAVQRSINELESTLIIRKKELESSQNYLDTIRYPDTDEEIKGMEAEIRLSILKLEQLKMELENYNIVAIETGILMEKTVKEGAFISVGQKMFQQSKEDEKHFVFYLPEEYIDFLSYGDEIIITSLSASKKGETFKATIDYIDYKAIYTPREGESSANKNKRSMKIKAILEAGVNLRAGERCRIQVNTKI